MKMIKSEHFVTISLDLNECEICHQCTGEELVTCKECFQPVIEEKIKEGFNELVGVVHQEQLGHEACFSKAHQVLNQGLKSNRKLSTDSVTSQLKGLLDGKFQQIIKYARNEGKLIVPQPLMEVKSTPCSRTSSPLRVSNARFDHATKRKCNSDENIALRRGRNPALAKGSTIYREKYEGITNDTRNDKSTKVEHAINDENVKMADQNKGKESYSHEPKFVKTNHSASFCHHRQSGNECATGYTIGIPSDRFVYLPCEHQYVSEGWTVDDLVCDVCGHHHHHHHPQINQSDLLISSQSDSSTDTDFDDLLPVLNEAKGSKVTTKEDEHKKDKHFKIYTDEELKHSSLEQLSEILETIKLKCTDVSSELVSLLQERDDLSHEVKVCHLMIEKLLSIH
ncbi:uncharacterized protein [Antedon mediterranea]|uniref:uncharacterized protein n=1 Tax=Antedon mediterranea TaxID=105859 RepID=UPI003AF44BE8